MTNEIDDSEIGAAVRLMEELCTAVGEQVVCYNWDESGTLTLVTPVNPQKEGNMSDGFKGTDFCELHLALGLKIEDNTEVDLEHLQWHLENVVSRMMLMDEKCDREVALCRGYVQAHIDHLREHKCISSREDAIEVYEAVLRVKEPHFFMKLTTGLIGMMWC